jgi:hypothetical protein
VTTWSWRRRSRWPRTDDGHHRRVRLRAHKEKGIRYWDAVDPDLSASLGPQIDAAFALQPEIIEFLEGHFGNYPFGAGGAIVDDYEGPRICAREPDPPHL